MADANDLIEDSPKHLSRRNVVVGTAWAVPVVMGVGATPAFAASTTTDKNAVYVTQAPGVGTNNETGTIHLNYAAVSYDPAVWGLQTWGNVVPSTATVTWEVAVEDAHGVRVATLTSKSETIAMWGTSSANSGVVTGLTAGTYNVVCRILKVEYSPNPVNGVRFQTTNSPSTSTSITVS